TGSRLRGPRAPASLARALLRPVQASRGGELPPRPRFDDARFCLERVQRYFPGLRALRLRRAWAGEIELTPDALPVIDGAGGPSGLVVATGMSGHGFGLAPLVGQVVAGLAEGAETGVERRACGVARCHAGSRLEPVHVL